MSPSKLRLWLQLHGEPISIKDIESIRYKETGTFTERQIRKSMKALESAGLVKFEMGPQNAKLWSLVTAEDKKTDEPAEPEAEQPDLSATGGIDPDYANSAE